MNALWRQEVERERSDNDAWLCEDDKMQCINVSIMMFSTATWTVTHSVHAPFYVAFWCDLLVLVTHWTHLLVAVDAIHFYIFRHHQEIVNRMATFFTGQVFFKKATTLSKLFDTLIFCCTKFGSFTTFLTETQHIKRFVFLSRNWSRRTMISLKPGGLATRNRIGAAKPVNRPQDLR